MFLLNTFSNFYEVAEKKKTTKSNIIIITNEKILLKYRPRQGNIYILPKFHHFELF